MFWRSIPWSNGRPEVKLPKLVHTVFLFTVTMTSINLSADPAHSETTNQSVQVGESEQRRIQMSTSGIARGLDALIDEFHSGGVTGEDLQAALELRAVVGGLATQEMQRIIVLLGDAQLTNDASAARDSLTAAVAGQKSVVTRIRDLLSKYRRKQVHDRASMLAAAADQLQQIRRKVEAALKQMEPPSPLHQNQPDASSTKAPRPSSSENIAAEGAALRRAGEMLADASVAVDNVAAVILGGSLPDSLEGTLRQAQQELDAAARHAAGNDLNRAQAGATAAQKSLTEAQDSLKQIMTETMQSVREGIPGSAQTPVAGGQTGEPIEKSAAGSDRWATGAAGLLPAGTDSDTGFESAHRGDRIVIVQPPPERVSTQYEALVDQYFKNLSDSSVGTKPPDGGTP